jgi:hypothetical protein
VAVGSLFVTPWFEALDDDGLIMPGAQLFFFLSGTSTPATTWADGDLLVPQTHPVIADSFGRAVVFLSPAVGDLKFILENNLSVQVGPTTDPVTPSGAGGGPGGVGAELFVFGSQSATNITATVYATGALYSALHPGTGVWLVDPATLTGTYALEVMGVMTAAGTLSVSLVNLDGGAPDVPIATATLTSLTGAVAQSGTITFPAGGAAIHFGIKTIVSASDGFLIAARIIRTA